MIKIFTHFHHIGHQYELWKLPYKFYVAPYAGRKWNDQWRPYPSKIKEIDRYEQGLYDIAIFHITEKTLDEIPYNQIPQEIPKIFVINCGPKTEEEIGKIKDIVGDCLGVCANYELQERLKLKRSVVIIHGLDSSEWWDNPNKNQIVYVIGGGLTDYHNVDKFNAIKERIPIYLSGGAEFNNFDQYREFLSKILIYFNPTLRSPMPRARTEAMLSGACIVTTDYCGERRFIKNGVNGFVSNDFKKLKYILQELIDNPDKAKKIGQKGKETAREIFSLERYLGQWQWIINQEINLFYNDRLRKNKISADRKQK